MRFVTFFINMFYFTFFFVADDCFLMSKTKIFYFIDPYASCFFFQLHSLMQPFDSVLFTKGHS